jgi:hypothetical protein
MQGAWCAKQPSLPSFFAEPSPSSRKEATETIVIALVTVVVGMLAICETRDING